MLASTTDLETAGNATYQGDHMGKLFSEGFSFSGFERDKLYLSDGGKRFVDISGLSRVDAVTDGRGAAYGDLDNDGDYDIFLTSLQGQVHHLFRNNIGDSAHFLRVDLVGTASGRDAYGATVRVKTSQGVLTKIKAGGSGFVSQSDPRLLFGLGTDQAAEWLEVSWPSGQKQRWTEIAAGSSLKITEGREAPEVLRERQVMLPDPLAEGAVFRAALRYGPGEAFPPVQLIDLDGKATSFDRYRQPGRSYIVNLWATYCRPCRQEMPALQALAPELKRAGVEIVGISLDMGKARARVPAFLEENGITYPVFLAAEETFKQIFRGEEVFVPLSFVVDADGRITDVLTGWSPDTEVRLRELGRPANPGPRPKYAKG